MGNLLQEIDDRTNLAGTNRLEILMFSLGLDMDSGREETFGINVFKVREVLTAPSITKAPGMPKAIEGMVSLRGALVPVIDLAKHMGIRVDRQPAVMIVTEYNGHTQGFLVGGVDNILRLDWSKMKVPPAMLAAKMGGLVTAVTELADKRLVMMLDVERILSETGQFDQNDANIKRVEKIDEGYTVFFADDSVVARNQVSRTLDTMGIKHHSAINGQEAWNELSRIADEADAAKIPVKKIIQLVLTDVEMPEMDGYMLTRKIKADKRFAGIPVVMHSSLSSDSNAQLGKSVGVDEYVPKFKPEHLSQVLMRLLKQG